MYDGKEITVTGLYRMVIHGSILTAAGAAKPTEHAESPRLKMDKHVLSVVRSVTKHDQFQPVEVVIRGTFRVAAKGQCFGQNCLLYEIEDHELQCAKAAKATSP